MSASEQAIVARCAAAVCGYCDTPAKWQPAALDEGDWYHKPVRGNDLPVWCDAGGIWHEFAEAAQPVFSVGEHQEPA